MQQAQFFLFGVLLIWLVGSGKLATLMAALRADPPGKAAVTGVGSLPSMPTGNPFDLSNPRNVINGDPFGLN
jgi:hypothetical protein